MNLTTLIFDLDNTLYSPAIGLWDVISQRINDFMQYKLKIPKIEIESLRMNFRNDYGTTFQGLKNLFSFDENEYLYYVHNIDLHKYISRDENLDRLLIKLPHRKIIFTNADLGHAVRVLNLLGVSHHFDQIIDIHSIKPYCKPQTKAFITALNYMYEPFPNNCAFIDDSQLNLSKAKKMGFFCIEPWSSASITTEFIRLESIYKLDSILFNNYNAYPTGVFKD